MHNNHHPIVFGISRKRASLRSLSVILAKASIQSWSHDTRTETQTNVRANPPQ